MAGAVFAALLAGVGTCARGAAGPITLEDLARLTTLGVPALSPEGREAALVLSQPEPDEARVIDTLMLVDTRTGAARSVASGTLKQPAFSPRGDRVAFLQADAEHTWQIMVAEVADAAVAPRAVTHLPKEAGAQQFAWSPDGTSLAYLAREAPHAVAGSARFDLAFEVAEADYLGTSFLDRNAGPLPTGLWIVAVSGGDPRQLAGGTDTIEQMAWRPDGRSLVFNAHPGTSIVAGRYGTINEVDLKSGQQRVLVQAPANLSVEARMRIASTGTLAYHGYRGQDPWLYNHHVTVFEAGQPRDVSSILDRDVMAFGWLPDGKALLVGAYDHVRTAAWLLPLRGSPRRLDLGRVEFEDFTVAATSGTVAFVGSESNLPPELYVLRALKDKPVRLTHFHDELAGKAFGSVEAFGWRGDGYEHTGVVTYPPGYTPAQRYPLLVSIHGGPHTSANLAFNGESQFFAAHGWIVLEPNYRGSSGEGEAYRTAVIGDATAGPGRDIRAGVDALIARGSVDPRRVALTGYSYGGVMTSWLIGHHQDWCAAMPGGVVVDFADYYDQSNTGIWIQTLLGSPHLPQNREKYVEQSPMSHLDQATTPTLVQQNVGDPNAGVTQAYTLYHALKDRGVKSRLVLFGVDGHGLEDPFLQRKSTALTLEWMQQNCPVRP